MASHSAQEGTQRPSIVTASSERRGRAVNPVLSASGTQSVLRTHLCVCVCVCVCMGVGGGHIKVPILLWYYHQCNVLQDVTFEGVNYN